MCLQRRSRSKRDESRCGWLVRAVLVATVSISAISAQDLSQSDPSAVWRDAVDRHVAGVSDARTQQIAPWRLSTLNSALAMTLKYSQAVANEAGPLLNGRLGRAAMMHADIAMINREVRGYGVAGTGTSSDVSLDGEVIGGSTRSAHWTFARRVLQERRKLFPSDRERAYSLLWYQATAAFLQDWEDYAELVPHLEEATRLHPRDPFLKLVQGSMREHFAEPAIQRAAQEAHRAALEAANQRPGSNTGLVAGVRDHSPSGPGSPGVLSVRLERQAALELFDDALKASPHMTEAAIRRANVLCRLNRAGQAVSALRSALDGEQPALLRYFGQLILGRCLLQIEQPLEADRAFATAEAVFAGQAPRLGRAVSALLLGLPSDDINWMRSPDADDPWLAYHRSHVPDAASLVKQLRSSRQ